MKVAITGASGHIGNNLARALISKGFTVNALCHHDTRSLDGLKLKRVFGNILSSDSLLDCFQDVEIVFHLASVISIDGDQRGKVRGINEAGTRFVAKACLNSGVRRLIHFSSIHALQQSPLEEILDETRPLVDGCGTVYDQSKAEAERIVLNSMQHGLEVVIISPTGVIGPHDYKPSLMGQGMISLYRGKLPALVPGGFDWVDVRDVVDGTINASENGESGERYLLSGNWISMKHLAGLVEAISGNPRPKFIAPFWLARLGIPVIRAYSNVRRTTALFTAESLAALADANKTISNRKATTVLNYHPRPLLETLEDTFQWYKEAEMLV